MRLIDFNRSTSDLDAQLLLYLEDQPNNHPVTDLRVTDQRLELWHTAGRPLTLNQFRARVQQVPPTTSLFIPGTPPQRLYGYRLVPHQILFG
ncbi:MAG TPA: hypothetical protein H9875_06760 [Candidatus Levilactobacillus faecigallinarum]|uniref:Uncharacterized protein n=1 Tax=Candidatus Levilactobacillus faecigallinarum TaxID=2838638 RepID=A0A9D1U5Y5_9LACO|nr:hypothetical protein [Candidatus Levilactobacillus faecigallinarum]